MKPTLQIAKETLENTANGYVKNVEEPTRRMNVYEIQALCNAVVDSAKILADREKYMGAEWLSVSECEWLSKYATEKK